MSTYTMTIQEILAAQIQIFSFGAPLPYAEDTDKQIDRQSYLQAMFLNRYLNKEIGFETIELFKQQLSYEWRKNIIAYNPIWQAYALGIDIKSNNSAEYNSTDKFYNMPQSRTQADEQYLTEQRALQSTTKSKSNITDMQLLDEFYRLYKDVDSIFIESFNNLFLMIY